MRRCYDSLATVRRRYDCRATLRQVRDRSSELRRDRALVIITVNVFPSNQSKQRARRQHVENLQRM